MSLESLSQQDTPLKEEHKTASSCEKDLSKAMSSTSVCPFATRNMYGRAQRNRTLSHPSLPQPTQTEEEINLRRVQKKSNATDTDTIENTNEEEEQELKSEIVQHSESHTFVVCADTQLGTIDLNREWGKELTNIRKAIAMINEMRPPPLFVSVCGDLVEMEASIYTKDKKYTKEECDAIQTKQNNDFKKSWLELNDRIPLICMCGNHDVGNRPTKESIERYRSFFGDEFFAFWSNGTYNIVVNNVLFNDPTGAPLLFDEQIAWLEERLKYANQHQAQQILVFGHHPWFLYDEEETEKDLKGGSPLPPSWAPSGRISDAYFSIRKEYRDIAMSLFRKYNVLACFSGHFHQNVISRTRWGMHMIITGPLSLEIESDGKPKQNEPNGIGIRIVTVKGKQMTHYFKLLE